MSEYSKNIPLTEAEVNLFESHIRNIGNKVGIKLSYIKNQLIEIVNPEYKNAKISQNQSIHATAVFIPNDTEFIIGKNHNGDNVFFEKMKFELHKIQRGGEISFNIWISFSGYIKIYKAREIEKLWTPGRYYFSKSIDGFNYDFIREKVVESLLSFQKLTLAKQRKLVEFWMESKVLEPK